MESGKLTEELSQDLRKVRRDMDELAVNLRRDFSGMHGDLTELKTQLTKLHQEHLEQVQFMRDAHGDFQKLNGQFSKALAEFNLAKSRMEGKFSDMVQRELKQYVADLKQNLSGFQELSREAPGLAKNLREAKAHVDTFTAVAQKLRASDFALVKFTHEVERINREKLVLLKKIDFLERLVAKERRKS